MPLITIEQLSLPAPHTFSVEIVQRAGTEKYNTLGRKITDGRREKRLLRLSWVRMDKEIMSRLFALVDETAPLTVTFPDPSGRMKTLSCFPSGRSARVWQYAGEAAWADVQLNLEEL